MPYEIDLRTLPPGKQRGLIVPDDHLELLSRSCAAAQSEIVTDRNVWKQHLLSDGYSKVNLRQFAVIKDQTGPSCASNGIVGAYEALLRYSGADCPILSAASVFSFVGGPGGSSIRDNVDRMTSVGCVPESMWPSNNIYGRKPPGFDAEAPKWRLRACEFVEDFAHGSWLLLRGRPIFFGVNWGGGGHAIWAPRLYWNESKGSSGWGWEIANSWGRDWGDDGFGVLYERQIESGIRQRYGAAAPVLPTYQE